jgi:hypothetical protein
MHSRCPSTFARGRERSRIGRVSRYLFRVAGKPPDYGNPVDLHSVWKGD